MSQLFGSLAVILFLVMVYTVVIIRHCISIMQKVSQGTPVIINKLKQPRHISEQQKEQLLQGKYS